MTVTDTDEVFAALDRLIAASDGFAAAWGEPDAALLERLEAFAGDRLPDDFRAFSLRYGNAHVGYTPIGGLGPVGDGVPHVSYAMRTSASTPPRSSRSSPTSTNRRRPGWSPSRHAPVTGGRVGPDLNVPQSVVEYRPEPQIRAYIRDPRTFRYSNMPSHPGFKEDDLDALLAYFRAMKDRKHDPEAAKPSGH